MAQKSTAAEAIRDMLVDCGLFDQLQCNDLLIAARYFGVDELTAGELIFSEGDAGTFMCILYAGAVAVTKDNADDKPVTVARLRAGWPFGEMAVLDGERRSASCIAHSDCILLTLSRDSLDRMLCEAPRTAALLIRALAVSMSKRLRLADGKLVNL